MVKHLYNIFLNYWNHFSFYWIYSKHTLYLFSCRVHIASCWCHMWPNTNMAGRTEHYGLHEKCRISPYSAECGKIRTRENSVFGHFSHSVAVNIDWDQSSASILNKSLVTNKGSVIVNTGKFNKSLIENDWKRNFTFYFLVALLNKKES